MHRIMEIFLEEETEGGRIVDVTAEHGGVCFGFRSLDSLTLEPQLAVAIPTMFDLFLLSYSKSYP